MKKYTISSKSLPSDLDPWVTGELHLYPYAPLTLISSDGSREPFGLEKLLPPVEKIYVLLEEVLGWNIIAKYQYGTWRGSAPEVLAIHNRLGLNLIRVPQEFIVHYYVTIWESAPELNANFTATQLHSKFAADRRTLTPLQLVQKHLLRSVTTERDLALEPGEVARRDGYIEPLTPYVYRVECGATLAGQIQAALRRPRQPLKLTCQESWVGMEWHPIE